MQIKQRFFIQRILELLHRETIDSYRARVLNPRLVLQELTDVYDGFMEGRIKRYEDLAFCKNETLSLLKKDNTILFIAIDKIFFQHQLLQKINKENCNELYPKIRTATRTILRENTNYLNRVLAITDELIQKPEKKDPFPELDELNALCGILATELLKKRYTKSFLRSFCYTIFVKKSEGFDIDFQKLVEFASSEGVDYSIWFKVYSPSVLEEKWPVSPDWEVVSEIPQKSGLPFRVQNFSSEKRNNLFLGRNIKAPDHFSALQIAKQELAEIFDLVRLAHHNNKIDLQPNAVVFPTDRPHLAGMPQVKHIPDGKFPDGDGVLNMLKNKIPKILGKDIETETKEKVKSSIRYLRFGHEAVELEHQLINYWIGLEYLFSNEKDSTFSRIKEIFPALHALVYFQRNIKEFHQAILQNELAKMTNKFNEEKITCMLEEECLESIRDDHYEDYPLLSYRAWRFKNKILKKGIKNYLDRHRKHLVWHLARIYRARNFIIHEAKYSFVSQTLTSNLRYYLTFSLSFIIDYFASEDIDARNLQEFFALQQLRLSSIEHEGYPAEKLIALKHDFDFLA